MVYSTSSFISIAIIIIFFHFDTMSSQSQKKDAFATLMGASKKAKPVAHKKGHKKPVKNLKAYYAPKKNSQGYPMKECKFQAVEGAYMYLPWWYGQSYLSDPKYAGIYPAYCRHCKLQPCLTIEENINMSSLGWKFMKEDKKPMPTVRVAIANRLEMKRRRLFDLDLGAPPSHTQCMTEYVNYRFPDKERKKYWYPSEDDAETSAAEYDKKHKKQAPTVPAKAIIVKSSNKQPLEDNKGNDEKQEQPWFHYGDTTSEEDNNDDEYDDDDNTPLALLRNHEHGDVPLEDRVKSYRKIQAKQKAVDAKQKENNSAPTNRGNLEELEEPSDEEWEF